MHTVRGGGHTWALIGNRSLDERTMTCVLPAAGFIANAAKTFRPPIRRCHLRLPNRAFIYRIREPHYPPRSRIRSIAFSWRQNLDKDDYAKWNDGEQRFEVEFSTQAFEEYRGGRWVPNSDHAVCFETQYDIFPRKRVALGRAKIYRVSEVEKWIPLRNPDISRQRHSNSCFSSSLTRNLEI
ncbi:hypothetical protein F4804DRAFT_334356 [Jackrogersella minutella]|nr:hypothetical protein F4804DRAFT_334356 [Jackrogersella minutella]